MSLTVSVFIRISTSGFQLCMAALFKMQPWDSKSKLNQEINKVTRWIAWIIGFWIWTLKQWWCH